jgi:hypothetical protein
VDFRNDDLAVEEIERAGQEEERQRPISAAQGEIDSHEGKPTLMKTRRDQTVFIEALR